MFEYKAKLLRVVDGDTLDCLADLGFNCHIKIRVRLYGVDTWESRTRDLEEKKKGLLAKQFVVDFLEEGSFNLISHGVGKYGRCLGEVILDDVNMNEELVKHGHAYKYHGGNKELARKMNK